MLDTTTLRSIILVFALCLSLLGGANAHPMDEWFVNIKIDRESGLTGVFRVPKDQVDQLTETPVEFSLDGTSLPIEWLPVGSELDGRQKLQIVSEELESFSELSLRIPHGLLDDNQSLVGFLKIGDAEPLTLLVSAGGEASFRLDAKAQAPNSVRGFARLGLTHIVEGYDHLLFLFCLLIAGGTFRHFLVVVTAFTLGHSLTLAASVLGYVSLPSQLTETAIALSIVLAALMNIPLLRVEQDPKLQTSMKSRGVMAGTFGLVHGLGFAGILKGIGIHGASVVEPLLGFNLGVELGQLLMVALFYPILMVINKWEKRVPFLTACSVAAAIMGIYWTLERMGWV